MTLGSGSWSLSTSLLLPGQAHSCSVDHFLLSLPTVSERPRIGLAVMGRRGTEPWGALAQTEVSFQNCSSSDSDLCE